MIEGGVNSTLDAVVTLPMQGQAGQTLEVDAVVDTGFNRFLTLPPTLVTELGLPFAHLGSAILANAEEAKFEMYHVTVLWDGQPRRIKAAITGSTPLAGMRLLDGHDLSIEVERGGRVLIEARP